MSKRPSYLGAHSQSGSSVGFIGWGNKKSSRGKVGLAQMSPAIDEETRYTLLKPTDVGASVMGRKKRAKSKDANRT